jgi:nicotinamidase-related amidase
MKPALLVIDVQKAFFKFDPIMTKSLEQATEYINAAIALFRKHQLPVVSIQHIDEGDNLVPGEEGFEMSERLKLLDTDLHIHKKYGNAFNKTPLAEELQKLGIDTLIITGFCAEYCILSTYRGALDLDLTPILLRNSLASDNLENIKFVESINDTISYGALKKFLG